MIPTPTFSVKAEKAANRLGDHAFFVRGNDADGDPAGRRERAALFLDLAAQQGNHVLSMPVLRNSVCFKLLTAITTYQELD